MKKSSLLFLCAAVLSVPSLMSAGQNPREQIYEMRTYYAPEGKLDDLHARFRDHTMKLFEKHGIRNIAYFVPEGANPEHKLIYLLAYPDRDARNASWKNFMSDTDWQKAYKDSEKNGRIVAKVEEIFLQPTDYSPPLKVEDKGGRIFELRTYTTPEGKLENLHSRFREHTMELFKKHGMENIVYFNKTPDQKGAQTTLVYLLAHKDKAAAKKSFDEFRADPAWVKVKTESEKDGSLTVPNGVKSELLVPTDYSPLK